MLIRRNPCRIKGGGQEASPERPVLTVPQMYAVADAIEPHFRALVLLATFGSLRWGELTALQRKDLNLDTGTTAPTSARGSPRVTDAFAETWGGRYPAAVKSLLTDRASLTTYLRFPPEHHKRIRHSNFIERTFGETRRRVKVIGRFPGETSCVSLVWAVLDRAAHGWRGFTMTSKGLRTLQDLRRALLFPPTRLHPAAAATTDSTPETAAA